MAYEIMLAKLSISTSPTLNMGRIAAVRILKLTSNLFILFEPRFCSFETEMDISSYLFESMEEVELNREEVNRNDMVALESLGDESSNNTVREQIHVEQQAVAVEMDDGLRKRRVGRESGWKKGVSD